MTDHELDKINKVRRQHGKSILSRQQAESIKNGDDYRAAQRQASDSGMDVGGFLFGYLTGMPISPTHGISAESIVGSMLHDSSDATVTRQDNAGSQDSSPAADTSSSDTSSPSDTSSSTSE